MRDPGFRMLRAMAYAQVLSVAPSSTITPRGLFQAGGTRLRRVAPCCRRLLL